MPDAPKKPQRETRYAQQPKINQPGKFGGKIGSG